MAVTGGLSPQKGIAKGARIRGLFAPSKKRRPRRLQIYSKMVKIGTQDPFDLNQEPDLKFFVPMVWCGLCSFAAPYGEAVSFRAGFARSVRKTGEA
jgi:hypothetical protein